MERQQPDPTTLTLVLGSAPHASGTALNHRAPNQDDPPVGTSIEQVYQDLRPGEIRLLTLSEEDGVVSCHMKTALRQTAKYDALSYSWSYRWEGCADSRILLNNQPVVVAPNLHAFLKRYAERDHLPIWTDALCLNQDNSDEKDEQIPLMRDIYGSAATVHVWLGPGTVHTDKAMEHTSRPDQSLAYPVDDDLLAGFGQLCRRDWWERTWTMQEAVLAREKVVVCGDRSVTWDQMNSMITYLMDQDLRVSSLNTARAVEAATSYTAIDRYAVRQDVVDAFASMKHLTFFANSVRMKGHVGFLELLHSTRLRGCTQPSDRIYGILGLTIRDFVNILEKRGLINCKSSYISVFLAVAKEYIIFDAPLLTLAMAASRSRPAGLPTWCPNWASPAPYSNFGSVRTYRAGHPGTGIYRLELATSNHCDQILVKGRKIDVVEKVEESFFTWDQDPRRWRGPHGCAAKLRRWSTACLDLTRDKHPDDFFDTYWRTMIGDKQSEIEKADPLWLRGCQSWQRALETYERGGTPQWQEGEEARVRDYQRFVEHACKGRRFFTTVEGRVGLGPPDTKPDDLVSLLYPARPVFVLRQTESEIIPAAKEEFLDLMQKSKWSFERTELDNLKAVELIGDAYVHGLMYGEGMEMADKKDERFLIA